MYKYQDGTDILIGDSVLFENGKTIGVVDLFVISTDDMKNFNVDEPGIMLKSSHFGFVFLNEYWLENDPLQLVSHAPTNPTHQPKMN